MVLTGSEEIYSLSFLIYIAGWVFLGGGQVAAHYGSKFYFLYIVCRFSICIFSLSVAGHLCLPNEFKFQESKSLVCHSIKTLSDT